ncbi:MAG TPA: riboflavin synthase [Myxococcota bacterium]|nr:riboflavin synthase [Myxococcota bacterium]
MFTGIIKGIGEVSSYDQTSFVLCITCSQFANLKTLGASVAINGVCLTVSHLDKKRPTTLGFDLGRETREVSLLKDLGPGALVNVELALAMGDPLDGHLVQGHVEGVAEIVWVEASENGKTMRFKCMPSLMAMIVPKGSIALDGVSLTVNQVVGDWFSVFLVPQTVRGTNFKTRSTGDLVHVETDIIGRYLHHFYRRLDDSHHVRTAS